MSSPGTSFIAAQAAAPAPQVCRKSLRDALNECLRPAPVLRDRDPTTTSPGSAPRLLQHQRGVGRERHAPREGAAVADLGEAQRAQVQRLLAPLEVVQEEEGA